MAVTAFWYGQALIKALNKEIDWDSDTIKVALVTSAYTPNQDTDTYWNNVVTSEVANGNGYITNGTTLTTPTITYTAGTNTIKLTGDNITWTPSTITARYAVIYDRTPGTDATRPLIGYVDFGVNAQSANGDFTITWDAAGMLTAVIA